MSTFAMFACSLLLLDYVVQGNYEILGSKRWVETDLKFCSCVYGALFSSPDNRCRSDERAQARRREPTRRGCNCAGRQSAVSAITDTAPVTMITAKVAWGGGS